MTFIAVRLLQKFYVTCVHTPNVTKHETVLNKYYGLYGAGEPYFIRHDHKWTTLNKAPISNMLNVTLRFWRESVYIYI